MLNALLLHKGRRLKYFVELNVGSRSHWGGVDMKRSQYHRILHFRCVLRWLNRLSALQKMMIERQVKVTPTFMLFRNHELIHTVSGINEGNLRTAVDEH